MEDRYLHQGLRRRMLAEIRAQGLRDELVLEAMYKVPRHWFVEGAFAERVYQNQAFPIEAGQTMSQPYTVAYQTAYLQVKPGDKVLEIGTGSGYQAAVLAAMGAEVHSIERQELLYRQTKALLAKIAPTVRCYWGDGNQGLPEQAPFQQIIVTAAAPAPPPELLRQLAPGGRLIVPVGESRQQQMWGLYKGYDGRIETEALDFFRFVPLLPGVEPKP